MYGKVILESLKDLPLDEARQVLDMLLNKMIDEGKVSGEDTVIFITEDGEMLGSMGAPHELHVLELGKAVGDGMALFVPDDEDFHFDLTWFEQANLVIIIPPYFEEDKFIIVDEIELTEAQNDMIDILSMIGFSKVTVVLPYK